MAERFVAFVRNVMIGREGLHRPVLLDLFEGAGATKPRSYISTGNVSFTAQPRSARRIARDVEDGIEPVIGRREPVFVRSVAYLADLVDADPFAAAPYPNPFGREVLFAMEPFEPVSLPIETARGDVSVFAATDREFFAVNRLVDGRTRAAGGILERRLGERLTARGWNTVLRVVANPE